MKLKWLIYPLRIFYVLSLMIGICTIPVLVGIMCITPILDVFCYIVTGKLQVMNSFCNWFFGEYPFYYLIYLKPENILKRIESRL